MFSIEKALIELGVDAARLRQSLVDARTRALELKERFPDLGEAIDQQVAELDARLAEIDAAVSEEAMFALAAVFVKELKQIGHLQFTPTAHADSGI